MNLVGPKGCGKTTTCKQRAKTIVEFQDEDQRENLLRIANTAPSMLLKGEKPILFDEWQDAPKIWGAIRKDCDDNPDDVGSYYLTGSSSKKVKTPHTGTLRISTRGLPQPGKTNIRNGKKRNFVDPSLASILRFQRRSPLSRDRNLLFLLPILAQSKAVPSAGV